MILIKKLHQQLVEQGRAELEETAFSFLTGKYSVGIRLKGLYRLNESPTLTDWCGLFLFVPYMNI
jgi:hypothetical protein